MCAPRPDYPTSSNPLFVEHNGYLRSQSMRSGEFRYFMSLLRSLSDGLRSLFRKERVGQALDEEQNGFLEMAAEEKMKQGMSRKDALSHRAPGDGECGNCEGSRPLSPQRVTVLVTEKIFFSGVWLCGAARYPAC
jgi:hypothetical protein